MKGGVAVVLLLTLGLAAQEPVELRLADGRVLPVLSFELKKDQVAAETFLGPLVFSAARLAGEGQEAAPRSAEIALRVSEGALLRVESDLDQDRHEQLAAGLEIFARYLVRHYELTKSDLVGAPFRVRAWRRRPDFKATQDRLAPAISKAKGQAFGEGVAGFYAPDLGEVHFWDGTGERLGARMELAQHEVTHLFNHLLARSMGRTAMPIWFEEGSAVYYSMTIADETLDGVDPGEPLEHEASLIEAISDIEAGTPYPLAELTAVPYAKFLGREYSWSWALVRELRRAEKGKVWPRLLATFRKAEAGGLDEVLATKAKTAAFEKDWHRHINLAAPLLVDRRLRRAERLVAAATAIAKPSHELARSYRSIARSYAAAALAEPALAFFAAAWRGGVEEPGDRLLAARLRAQRASLADDEVWPAEAQADLRRAIELDALLAEARQVRGEQLLLAGDEEGAARELALALYLAAPNDDVESLAFALLRLEGAAALIGELQEKLPHLVPAFARARVQFLQAEGRFPELLRLLVAREAAGQADLEEILMLADLEMLVDQPGQAAARLARLLAADPRAHHLRPRLARALVAAGRRAEARTLREETRNLARARGLDLGFVLDRIDSALAGD